jgi:hypothetical protein
MAEHASRSGGWIGIIAAIALVAVIGAGIYGLTAGQNLDVASLEINVPDIDLPDSPTIVPPSAEQAISPATP